MTWKPESHWDAHPDYPVGDWQHEVGNGDTRLSYIDWVSDQIAEEPMLLISKACRERVVGWLESFRDILHSEGDQDSYAEMLCLISKLNMLEEECG
jgi:hypothetical protein